MRDKISRREFIKKSALGAAAGSAVLSSINLNTLMAKSKAGRFYRAGGDIVVNLQDKKNDALSKVGGAVFLDDENMLIRISQAQFTAVNLICRHKGCTVELTGNKFVCPCHGSEYDLNGKVTEGPAKSNLITYQTDYNSEKGTVTVKMPDKEDSKE